MVASQFSLTGLEYIQNETSYLIICYGCISSAVGEEVY